MNGKLISPPLTTAEAAKLLGVSQRRVQALVKARRIAVVRSVGRTMLLDAASVEALAREDRPRGGRPPWPDEDLALLGTDTDAAVAKLLGKSRAAVSQMRTRLRIPAHEK